ncbi:TetR/AcrR family transcriptional regulator [Actinomadura sediminis]|uniref:TetR/AcrR family transcriptional regulator n=1 Tax=Actinomadura sediminis TaxID=1038904 RepID=A0ABW3ESF6_9ACTN
MTKERYHHGDLRSALLDAAEALVRERGADGWSLREASARVGVSPSAAYHHFASREALVRALSARVLTQLAERMNAPDPAPAHTEHDRLVAIGRTYVTWAVEDPAVFRLAHGTGSPGPDLDVSPHPHDVLDAELDRLVNAGVLPPASRPGAEFVVWAAVHGLAALLTEGSMALNGPDAIDHQVERVVRTVLSGLKQEPTPSPPWPTAHSPHTDRRERANQPHPQNLDR